MPNLPENLSERLEANIAALDATITVQAARTQHQVALPPDYFVDAAALERCRRPESPPPSPPYRRPSLWQRIRQHWCAHYASSAVRVPGSMPAIWVRHCPRCKAQLPELGE